MIWGSFLSFQAVAIQENINAVNTALLALENLAVSFRTVDQDCIDLKTIAEQINNDAVNDPDNSAISDRVKSIDSVVFQSCDETQKSAIINSLKKASEKLKKKVSEIRTLIVELGN